MTDLPGTVDLPDASGPAVEDGPPIAKTTTRVVTGLLDQALIAAANAGTTLLAILLLPNRRDSDAMLLAIGLAYLAIGLNRAFVGDVLVAKASRLRPAAQRTMIRDGLATATVAGLAAAAALMVLGLWVRGGGIDLADCLWVAPFLPLVLVHDTGRQAYVAQRAQASALRIDLMWIAVQVVVILAGVRAGLASGALILVGWGMGGGAGAIFYCVRSGNAPWQGIARRWVRESRHLSGWFTATAVVGQLQVQAVAFLVAGPLGPGQLTALRGAQTVVLQPTQNIVLASLGLVVPRSARLAAAGDAAALGRQTRRLGLAFLGIGLLGLAVFLPLADAVLPHLPKLEPIQPLVLPVGLQAVIYLIQVPITAAMRGMHRARLLFGQYAAFSGCSLAGLIIGASTGRLVAAVWGLAIGAIFGFVVMVFAYRWALRRLTAAPPDTSVVAMPPRSPASGR